MPAAPGESDGEWRRKRGSVREFLFTPNNSTTTTTLTHQATHKQHQQHQQQIGFPYQYFTGWRRNLWTMVFAAQLALSRALPSLMPPPTFMMVQDSSLDYATILARARRAAAVGRALLLAAAAAVAAVVMRVAARGVAA